MSTKYFAPSVDYAAKIFVYLSRYKTQQSTLTEISEDLDINKSTVLRVLKTLEIHRLIYYDEKNKQYSLGVYHTVLGNRVNETLDYLKIINPYLSEATEKTGLTTALVQQVSVDRLMFVSQVETENHPKLVISIGNKFPITEVSFGKWYISYMNEEDRELYLRDGLKQKTKNTNTNINDYLTQIKDIKRTNVLVSREEYTEGVLAVSSPLFDNDGKVLAVLSLLGMAHVVTNEQVEKHVETLKEITNRCNNELKKIYVQNVEFKVKG